MPKFIVIDHSICGIGGHYYEYARHVLGAAEEAGFDPVLATNRKFTPDEEIGWRVHPVYRCGFWANQSPPRWSIAARSAKKKLTETYLRCRTRLFYSELRVMWLMRRQARTYLRLRSRSISPPAMLLLIVLACLYKLGAASARGLRQTVPGSTYLSRVIGRFRARFHALRTRIARAIGPHGWALEMLADRYRARQFSRATLDLARSEPIGANDVVLLPTVSELELTALAETLRRLPALSQARWHLVFRRSVFPGSQPLPPASTTELTALRNAFQRCAELHRNGVLSFYSDTEELSEHYSLATGLAFKTLPIPHTSKRFAQAIVGQAAEPRNVRLESVTYGRPAAAAAEPVRICYLGDARTEKGYQHLPHIVGDLWRDYVRAGKATFTIQSNYNVPLGEPAAIVARSKLRQYAGENVRLIETPLASHEYWDILLASGVNLLLYDRQNYYARSSGILAESLAAGVPVLVPAGTWMSRQIVDEIYSYRLSLCGQMQVVESLKAGDLRPRIPGRPASAARRGDDWILGATEWTRCRLAVPPLAQVLSVSFSFENHCPADLIEVDVEQRGHDRLRAVKELHYLEPGVARHPAVLLVRLRPGMVQTRLALRSAADGRELRLAGLRVEFLDASSQLVGAPMGSVGVVYRSADELTGLLREMIQHHAHYRSTARRFSEQWAARHNAPRLVECLTGVMPPIATGSLSASDSSLPLVSSPYAPDLACVSQAA